MNRKQKIIVSITGIFLVPMILVGLTYAYFLTKITGNTNSKSISVTTANLELVYGDGNNKILQSDNPLEPSADAIGTKDFTVTNEGNSKTSYVVVIEDLSIKNTTDNTTTTFESNDFRYTLTCTKKDGTTCDGVTTQSVFPITGGIMVGNSIDVDDVQSYVLTLWYIDTGIDQSKDMNKTLEAKVNIKDITQVTNPYSSNTNSLAYNIIENAKNKTNGTELLSSPKTKVAEEVTSYTTGKIVEKEINMNGKSACYGETYDDAQPWNGGNSLGCSITECTDTIIGKYLSYATSNTSYYIKSCKNSSTAITEAEELKYESSLLPSQDDYGISYYYRGNVTDNYVDFAGMCWRIVRIAGDSSIKLILEDKDSACSTSDGNWEFSKVNYGYDDTNTNSLGNKICKMNYLEPKTNPEKSLIKAFYDFQKLLENINDVNYLSKLKGGDWCLNDTAYTRNGSSSPYKYNNIENTSNYYTSGTTFYYNSYVRLAGDNVESYQPTLKCNGTNLMKFKNITNSGATVTNEEIMYVGTLTADEVVYAGGTMKIRNDDFYLMNGNNNWYWLLSPSEYSTEDRIYFVQSYTLNTFSASYDSLNTYRPSVNLKPGIELTGGDGTKSNAFKVS